MCTTSMLPKDLTTRPATPDDVDAQSLTGATRLYEKAGMHVDVKHQRAQCEKELRPGQELATQSV